MKQNRLRTYFSEYPVAKGYLFAFLATLGMANVYVFSKAALRELEVIQFGFYWFGFAMLFSVSYMLATGKIKLATQLDRKSNILLIIIGTFETAAASTLYIGIETIENPTVASFLANLTPIFVTILGVSFLRERFNLVEGLGIILTIVGAILISYTGQKHLKEIFIEGTGYILLSSFFLSVSIIIAKSRIVQIDPSLLMLNRIVYIFFFALFIILYTGTPLKINPRPLFNVTIGAMLGPFLTGLAQYSSIKYIEASRTMIIQSTRGLFVAVGAIIYLNIFPESFQIIGGIITIAGVVIITMGRSRFLSRKQVRAGVDK